MSTKSKGRPVPPRSGTDPRTRLPGETTLGQVFVSSGFGMNTREPFVAIEMPGHEPIQFGVDEARFVAHLLLEACEAAEQDGALTEWIRTMYAAEPEDEQNKMAAAMLNEIRAFREMRRRKARTTSA